jgi:hypothetical protein
MVPFYRGLNGNANGAGQPAPKPQLPPQLCVVSRTPDLPLETSRAHAAEFPGRWREATIHEPGNRPADLI